MDPETQPTAGAGENEPTDREERTSAALELLTAEEPAAAAEPKTSEPAPAAAAAEPKPGEAKPGEPKPAEAAAAGEDIAKAPFFNDPAFQKYHAAAEGNRTVVEGFRKMFNEGRYAIGSEETLRAVHEDAFLLYDIAAGKAEASQLLEVMKKNWTPEQFTGVLQQLADYAAANKITGKEIDPNSAEGRIARLEADRKKDIDDRTAREQKDASDRQARDLQSSQMKTVDSLIAKVTELCKGKGLDDKKEIDDYVLFLSGQLGRNPEMVKQLEKGQFGEAERIFAERHAELLERFQRYNGKKVSELTEKNRSTPKQAAGGASAPGATTTTKPNLADGEQRRKAAYDLFKAPA